MPITFRQHQDADSNHERFESAWLSCILCSELKRVSCLAMHLDISEILMSQDPATLFLFALL